MAPIEGPECPFEDPLHRDELPMNVTLDPLAAIDQGSMLRDLNAAGLSTVHYVIDINVILLSAAFDVNITNIDGNANYEATGYVDARPFREVTVPAGNFTGSGVGKVTGNTLRVKGSASIFLTPAGKVQLSRLVLDIVTFGELNIDLGQDFEIGGKKIDWAEFSKNLKANFDQDFAQFKSEIQTKIRGAANNILVEYTLQELIDIINRGGGSCEDP